MASTVPIVRQIAWISLIPQLLLMGLFIYVFHLLNLVNPFIFGALTYLILSFGLRNLIAKNHRKGINFIKQQKFTDAIPYFHESIDYFSKNAWIDKYRFMTILSSSKMSYREMGLCNIAFCYSQTGDGQKAKEFYQQTLKDYPENGMAIAGLNMLKSLDHKAS